MVQVTDSTNPFQTATANFTITVFNSLAITTTSLPDGDTGHTYRATVTARGGTPPYSFTIISGSLPTGLSMAANGAITGTPSGSNGTSNFTVQVADSSSPTQFATASLSITIDATLMITTGGFLPVAIEGIPYSATVTAIGGTAPYTFSLAGGSIWAGLSLSTSGVISGTPPNGEGGASGFDVRVTDSSNPPQTAIQGFTLTVVSKLKIETRTLPPAVLGVPYSATIIVHGGFPPEYSAIIRGALPQGLSLNFDVISGTPTQLGVSNFTFEVVDSASPPQTAKANLSITVGNAH